VNYITKKPEFRDQDILDLKVGEYATNAASIDVNRRINSSTACRLIVSGQRNSGSAGDWAQQMNGYNRSFTVLAELAKRFKNGSDLLVQYTHYWRCEMNGDLFPIDPAAGTNGPYSTILPGIGQNAIFNPQNVMPAAGYPGSKAGQIYEAYQDYKIRYTAKITDRLSMRLFAGIHRWRNFAGVGGSASGGWFPTISNTTYGSYDPQTGLWTPYVSYGPGPTYTPTPITPPTLGPGGTFIVTPSGAGAFMSQMQCDYGIQNDFAYVVNTGSMKSTTLFGWNFDEIHTWQDNYPLSSYTATPSPVNVYNYASTILTPVVNPSPASYYRSTSTAGVGDVYVDEQVNLWRDRITLKAGITQNRQYNRSITTYPNGAGVVSNVGDSFDPHMIVYGGIVRITPDIEVYYGHTENSSAIFQPFNAPPPYRHEQRGIQDEEGARIRFLDGRAMVTVCHYKISQTNFQSINPLSFAIPAPSPLPPPLLTDRLAKGWEYTFNAALTPRLSVIGNFTNFTNRDFYNLPLRGVADTSSAAFLHYDMRKDQKHGPQFGIGVVHVGKRPGDTPSGFAAASTPDHPLPNQPSFYNGPYTLVNVSASYDFSAHVTARLFIDNLLNEKYIAGSISRGAAERGTPFNPKIYITYQF
jgi:iron complex outermembrane receptor protein